MTDPQKSAFKLTFRIEQLPDGTFVGKSDNPKLEIKGATPQEVQQKIQQSMGSRIVEKLGIHLAAAVTGDGIEVTGTSDSGNAPAPGLTGAPGTDEARTLQIGPVTLKTTTHTSVMVDGKRVDGARLDGATPAPYDGGGSSQQFSLRL